MQMVNQTWLAYSAPNMLPLWSKQEQSSMQQHKDWCKNLINVHKIFTSMTGPPEGATTNDNKQKANGPTKPE